MCKHILSALLRAGACMALPAERTIIWLAGCRRLHRRYEHEAEHFLAFSGIAGTLICYGRLTN